jgi:probable phosphoglycerate mutase
MSTLRARRSVSDEVEPRDPSEPHRQARFVAPRGAANVLLVRHGESAPIVVNDTPRRSDTPADPPLDPRGRDEAALVCTRLAGEPIAAIYVSTLRRTAETAAPLAATLGLEPIVEPHLREVFLGDVDGQNLRVLARGGNGLVRRALAEESWELLTGAERQRDFAERVRAGIMAIAARHADETVAVFTHGGVIGQALAEATGCRPHAFTGADNASVTHLVVRADRWIVRGFNDIAHLR